MADVTHRVLDRLLDRIDRAAAWVHFKTCRHFWTPMGEPVISPYMDGLRFRFHCYLCGAYQIREGKPGTTLYVEQGRSFPRLDRAMEARFKVSA